MCVLQNVLFTLAQLSGEFPEVADVLAMRLKEADLRLPQRGLGQTSADPAAAGRGRTPGGASSAVQPRQFQMNL